VPFETTICESLLVIVIGVKKFGTFPLPRIVVADGSLNTGVTVAVPATLNWSPLATAKLTNAVTTGLIPTLTVKGVPATTVALFEPDPSK
jgi:hypothetical protein